LREAVLVVRKTIVPQLAHAPRRLAPMKMGLARAARPAGEVRVRAPRSIASDR
jgi:hypothetical protein